MIAREESEGCLGSSHVVLAGSCFRVSGATYTYVPTAALVLTPPQRSPSAFLFSPTSGREHTAQSRDDPSLKDNFRSLPIGRPCVGWGPCELRRELPSHARACGAARGMYLCTAAIYLRLSVAPTVPTSPQHRQRDLPRSTSTRTLSRTTGSRPDTAPLTCGGIRHSPTMHSRG